MLNMYIYIYILHSSLVFSEELLTILKSTNRLQIVNLGLIAFPTAQVWLGLVEKKMFESLKAHLVKCHNMNINPKVHSSGS